MEKKEKTPRRKTETPRQTALPQVADNSSPDLRSVTEDGVSLGRLSELADSARKMIIKSADSGQEGAGSAQADLLKSRNKVEEVRKRIQTGYYGQPDVIGRIIDKLADDLRP